MVRHLCLMHLPVHPKGVAKLKEACDSRHLLKDVSEIGTLCEYKIDYSDNQNALKTNSLWIIFSCSYLCASGKQNKTLSLASVWIDVYTQNIRLKYSDKYTKKKNKQKNVVESS